MNSIAISSGSPSFNTYDDDITYDLDIQAAEKLLSDCTLCPRSCHVNRLDGQTGFCGEGGVLRASRAALYYTEEPVISGKKGSGTVFFTGCSLGCIYCQNRQISSPGQNPGASSVTRRVTLTPERLTEICFELEAQGAHNINLVTPEHFVPLIIPALRRAKTEGLSIPIVYNTGSYEKVETVRALEGLVDVWLPDLKYVSSRLSALHTGAADYFACASAAIAEMVRQCPDPVFSDGSHAIDCPDDADDPLMIRGVLVRHLALPGCGEDSRAVLRYLHETYGDHIFISIMNQYTPMPQVLAQKLTGADHPGSSSGFGNSSGFGSRSGSHIHSGSLIHSGSASRSGSGISSGSGNSSGSDSCSYSDSRPGSGPGGFSDLCRTLSEEEYDSLIDYAIGLGIQNGFVQESGTVSPSYIPLFDGTGI